MRDLRIINFQSTSTKDLYAITKDFFNTVALFSLHFCPIDLLLFFRSSLPSTKKRMRHTSSEGLYIKRHKDNQVKKNKKKMKKKIVLKKGDTAECLDETPAESLSEKLGTLCRKFNSKSSLNSHVEMDPTGGANSVEESKENAAAVL